RGLELARGGHHAARGVVDRLRVDVARGAKHRQPRPLGGARQLQADRDLATDALALLGVDVRDVTSHVRFSGSRPLSRWRAAGRRAARDDLFDHSAMSCVLVVLWGTRAHLPAVLPALRWIVSL